MEAIYTHGCCGPYYYPVNKVRWAVSWLSPIQSMHIPGAGASIYSPHPGKLELVKVPFQNLYYLRIDEPQHSLLDVSLPCPGVVPADVHFVSSIGPFPKEALDSELAKNAFPQFIASGTRVATGDRLLSWTLKDLVNRYVQIKNPVDWAREQKATFPEQKQLRGIGYWMIGLGVAGLLAAVTR